MDELEKKAYEIYEKHGQYAVFDYAAKVGINTFGYCEPCEIDSPIYDGSCLVCATVYEGKITIKNT